MNDAQFRLKKKKKKLVSVVFVVNRKEFYQAIREAKPKDKIIVKEEEKK